MLWQTAVIIWRESVEALLVIGILHAWLVHEAGEKGRSRGTLYLWGGVAAGLAAAVALGASIVETHFTVDRGMEGNDHKVSLLPGEFAEMVVRIREVEEALGNASPRAVSTGEMMNQVNLDTSHVAARDHEPLRRTG